MDSAVVSPELLPRHPHALPVADVASELGVDPSVGLSQVEVERRCQLFGPNLLATRKPVSDLALPAAVRQPRGGPAGGGDGIVVLVR